MDHRISPPVACVPPRETSDRAEVLKNGFAQAGTEDKRECRTVRAYGTVIRWSGGQRTIRANGTVVRSSTYDTCVRYGRQVVNVENNLTYHVQAIERTIRAYGTRKHRMEEPIKRTRGLR